MPKVWLSEKDSPGSTAAVLWGHGLQRILWLLENALLKGEPSENFLGSFPAKAWV
jgi:hypothetical protein